ncbi:MAG: SOS response-associated peptidase [Phycisphaerales bacterium]|nr:SOS response-associated peptidase [Phycisphaerales bacterium]
MCGRFAQVFEEQGISRIEQILRAACSVEDLGIPCFNTAPTDQAGIVVQGEQGQAHRSKRARFGLVPAWSDGPGTGPMMMNARSETVREKAAFRGLVRSRRCVVPISGFFEWEQVAGEKRKRPWYVTRADGGAMLLAGVWDSWVQGGSELDSFSILTMEPDSFLGAIHDRMPVILENEETGVWMDREASDREIDRLLGRGPIVGVLTGHRVGRGVATAARGDAGVIEAIDGEEGEQGTLF